MALAPSCTRITMQQVGEGETCLSDAQCTAPLTCISDRCASEQAFVGSTDASDAEATESTQDATQDTSGSRRQH